MSVESHLAELQRRHQAIELEIEEAMSNPSADDLEISKLKRRKLRIKDEIARLSNQRVLH